MLLVKGGYTENLIPVMTSNTSPEGIASASGIVNGFPAYLAMDRENVSGSDSWMVGSSYGWLSYEFSAPQKISKYIIKPRHHMSYGVEQSPKNWTFEGSDDGIAWNILDTRDNIIDWVVSDEKEFSFENNKEYKKYRINISSNNGGANIAIGELQMFELLPSTIKSLPSQTEQDFITHGLDNLSSLDPTAEYTKKQYIQNQSSVLGAGKTFEQPIDLSKYKVNKITFQ